MSRRELERLVREVEAEMRHVKGPPLEELGARLRAGTMTSRDLDALFVLLDEHLHAWLLVCALHRRSQRRRGVDAPHRWSTPMGVVVEVVSYAVDEALEPGLLAAMERMCFRDETAALSFARRESWPYILKQVTRGRLLGRHVGEPEALTIRHAMDSWSANLQEATDPMLEAPAVLLEAVAPILRLLPDHDLIWDHRSPPPRLRTGHPRGKWTGVDIPRHAEGSVPGPGRSVPKHP